jgi:hydroxymethylpyrimidine/phosphomethylpyrimidine kinase
VTVVVAGGVDPGGGAGILRDVATAKALAARPHAVGTAWTEQGDGVHRIEPRDPAAVTSAMLKAVAGLRPRAVKIGMAVGPPTARALIDGLIGFPGSVIVDPVLATSRGGPLWDGPPRALLPLLRRAALATPNAVEAAALTGVAVVATVAQAEAAGRALIAEGVPAVLVKGGHMPGDSISDVLVTAAGARVFTRSRIAGATPRGTGCALATALAVGLGRGLSLEDAVEAATTWLANAIATARRVGDELHLGA